MGFRHHVRTRPIGLKTVAAITTAQWVGRRTATRLTPIFLALLALIGVPVAFFTDLKVILVIGLCLVVITYATQRHVSTNERVAKQWALRATALPIAATCWVLVWYWMHRNHKDVINENMALIYLVFGVVTWSWLYVSRFVGVGIAWERAQRDFAPVARAVGLPGAAIVKTVRTAVGSKQIIDIRGTGKTASEIVKTGQLGELMAGHGGLPDGRVQVQKYDGHAGYISVSEWTKDPWKDPIPHPNAGTAFDFPCTPVPLAGAIPAGADPETGEPLNFELINDEGGVHWIFIAGTRGGKTNLINNVVEYLTRCVDKQARPLVRITMIDILKGYKDAANWGPAVSAVHAGPKGIPGALASLQQAVNLISARAEANGRRGRSKHVATADEPAEIIIIDEASFLLSRRTAEGRRAIELVNTIYKGGASELVLVIIAAQRAVLEHLGSGDPKANAFGTAVLPVRKPIEQTNIISDWREQGMPNMKEYGGGRKGTVLLVLNDAWQAGRTFELWRLSVIRKIALSRVLPQNEAMVANIPHRSLADAVAGKPAPPMHVKITGPTTDELIFDNNPLVTEPPADGVDDGDEQMVTVTGRAAELVDEADGLDFDAAPELPPETRPGQPAASVRGGRQPARPVEPVQVDAPTAAAIFDAMRALSGQHLTDDQIRAALAASGWTDGRSSEHPDGLDGVAVAGVQVDGVVVASGPGAEDEDAVEAARVVASDPDALHNVRPIHPDAPPWVRVDEVDEAAAQELREAAIEAGEVEADEVDELDEGEIPNRTDGLDEVDTMTVQMDRMVSIAQWAAAKEAARTPAERAALVRAWREHTWHLDQGIRLPADVNAAIKTLAVERGPEGFTRAEAQELLRGIGAADGKTSVASYLRIFTNQGHLECLRGQGPNGADLYRLGERHRETGA